MTEIENEPSIQARERRAVSRLKFEETGEIEEQVTSGIKRRVDDALNGKAGEEAVFSQSAAEVVRSMVSDIILRKGSVVIRESGADKYGHAFISRHWDTGDFVTSEIANEDRVVIKKIPALSVPETPIDPNEVNARTDRGELKFEYTPSKTMAMAQFKDGGWGEFLLDL